MTSKNLDHWRLSDRLSVPHAAVLILGEDPSAGLEPNFETGDPEYRYDGFYAVFESLKSAVIAGSLNARLAYPARTKLDRMPGANATVVLEMGRIETELSYDIILPPEEWVSEAWTDQVVIE
ncbi:hypothetical protein ACOI1H_10430, partial [Loktanella sp. DJP18]|uniref:hypothetical protein n=1 Tax=Loktanella sp. DJP18 TaxID=3409788 RepID=UPI003BB56B28